MKEKLKTTSFWLSVGSAIIIMVECISSIFGFDIAPEIIENIVISICSILVLFGVVTKRNVKDKEDVSKDELLDEIREVVVDDKDENN